MATYTQIEGQNVVSSSYASSLFTPFNEWVYIPISDTKSVLIKGYKCDVDGYTVSFDNATVTEITRSSTYGSDYTVVTDSGVECDVVITDPYRAYSNCVQDTQTLTSAHAHNYNTLFIGFIAVFILFKYVFIDIIVSLVKRGYSRRGF